jgi:hypothetical protein
MGYESVAWPGRKSAASASQCFSKYGFVPRYVVSSVPAEIPE